MPAKKRKRKSGRLSSQDLDQVIGAGPLDVARKVAKPREEFTPDAPRAPQAGPPRDDFSHDKPPQERPFSVPSEAPVEEHVDNEKIEPKPADKSWVMTDEEWDQVPTEEPVEDPVENEQKFTPERRDRLKKISRSVEYLMDQVKMYRPRFEFDSDLMDRLKMTRYLNPETRRVTQKTFVAIMRNMEQTIIAIQRDIKMHEQEDKIIRAGEKTKAEEDLIAARGLKKARKENG